MLIAMTEFNPIVTRAGYVGWGRSRPLAYAGTKVPRAYHAPSPPSILALLVTAERQQQSVCDKVKIFADLTFLILQFSRVVCHEQLSNLVVKRQLRSRSGADLAKRSVILACTSIRSVKDSNLHTH